MRRIKFEKLPKDVIAKIDNFILDFDGEFRDGALCQVCLKDEWTFEDGSHISTFATRKELIDIVRDAQVSRSHLLELWERFSSLVGADQTEEVINESNELLLRIEELLPFKNLLEHDHWLDVAQGFRCWEDFEELTLNIIRRLK